MKRPISPVEEWFEQRRRGWSKFDRVSVVACLLLGGAALAVGATFATWELVYTYFLCGVLLALIAAIIAFFVRLAVFGRLPANVDELLPLAAVRVATYWLVVKFGILGACLYLIVAAGISVFLRWPVAFLVQGFVLLAFAMMIGNCVQSIAVNISLIWRRRHQPRSGPSI